ncbi:unnamed protein product, partial [Adineta ricciae]
TSFNQPKLSSSACWDPHTVTLTTDVEVEFVPVRIFVDRKNTIYVTDIYNEAVHVWRQDTNATMKTTIKTSFKPFYSFTDNDGYIFTSISEGSVMKWSLNTVEAVIVIRTESECFGLSIDIKNNLYCSLSIEHRVVRQTLDVDSSTPITVAGTGKAASTSDALYNPRGIFLSINLDLYVADCSNNRVQLFEHGQKNGVTVAGKDKLLSITLSCPTSVFLDENNNIFILDSGNGRIMRSTSQGFDCVVGCSAITGSASHQMHGPLEAVFDTFGNIFIADFGNDRIQKFQLTKNISDYNLK